MLIENGLKIHKASRRIYSFRLILWILQYLQRRQGEGSFIRNRRKPEM
jgi:hypothetical protein